MDGGWIGRIVAHPEDFAALTQGSDREGWAALHRGDYPAAARAFGKGLGAARALEAERALDQDLSRLSGLVAERTYSTWATRGGIPEGSAIPLVAALAALDSGDLPRAQGWLDRAGKLTDPTAASAGRALHDGLHALGTSDALARRIDAHLEARSSGQLGALEDQLGTPLIQEQGSTGPRLLQDPLVFGTLAAVAGAGSRAALDSPLSVALRPADHDPPLEGLLFSAWWGAEEQQDELSHPIDLAEAGALGPRWLVFTADDDGAQPGSADYARARVAALDARLDAWQDSTADAASPDGRALLESLDLVRVYRAQLLVGWTRRSLREEHPDEALGYAQQAQDLRSPRQIGPTNPPALYALMAEAELRRGHAREALDALSPLRDFAPTLGLSETLSDLAVLDGMGRIGDSKEN